jgi:hypothetical protein
MALPFAARRHMPKRTWIELGVQNAGMRKTLKAINWAYCWAVVRESLNRDPTVEEVADWWNSSRRSAFRDQAAFREAFPNLDSPAPIYDSADARARIAKHAAVADRIDKWVDERKARREQDSLSAVLAPAREPRG